MKNNKLLNIGKSIVKTAKSNAPSILAFGGAVGVIVTAGLAARGTVKAIDLIDRAEKRKGKKLTKFETVKTAAPAFLSTFIVGGTTIAFIFAGDRYHRKRELAIGSAYAAISQAYQEYRQEVSRINGSETDQKALANIRGREIKELNITPADDEKVLFFEELSGKYFESTMLDVVLAEYHFNRNYWLRGGYGSLNEFYDFLNIPRTPAGAVLGWSAYWGEAFYGYTWVDFQHTFTRMDDGLECYIISYPFAPTANYESVPEY